MPRSDDFEATIPGICEVCLNLQTQTPSLPWYYCEHRKVLVMESNGEWETYPGITMERLNGLLGQQRAEAACFD